MNTTKKWSTQDVEKLKENFLTSSWPELLSMFNRSQGSITRKAKTLDMRRQFYGKYYKNWDSREIEILENLYGKTNTTELAKILDRPVTAILKKSQDLGLSKIYRKFPKKQWNEIDDNYLKKWLHKKSIVEISEALNCSRAEIYKRMNSLGLEGRGSIEKGQAGKPFPIGSIRIQAGIEYKKISSSGDRKVDWKRLDVIKWEEANGTIPDGMILMKSPGQPRILENLRLISKDEIPALAAAKNMCPQTKRLIHLKMLIGSAAAIIRKKKYLENSS